MISSVVASSLLRRVKEIRETFVGKGAISPETAMTLNELELENKTVIDLMILRDHIVKVGDKYYMDVDKFDDRAVKQIKNFIINLFDEIQD